MEDRYELSGEEHCSAPSQRKGESPPNICCNRFNLSVLPQKGLKNLDTAGKNVLDAGKNVDALMGGFMKKGLNVNVKDAKNVMNAVSVSVRPKKLFSVVNLFSAGHIKGRRAKEPDS